METRVNLKNCNFSGCHFRKVNFQNVDFSGDDLTGAAFYNCNLSDVSFEGAILRNVVFKDVNLKKIDFEGAMLEGISFYYARGVYQVGPVGILGSGIAVDWEDKIMFYFHDGHKKFWGTDRDVFESLDSTYSGTPICDLYKEQVRLAVKILEEERKYY